MDITPNTNVTKPTKHVSTPGESIMHMFDGLRIKFPIYKHDHPPVVNVNEVADEQLTMGQRIADKVAARMGSWGFIISQAMLMVIWITLNLVGWFYHWDIYPFVLLNLAMSAQAAFATPLIMMSQNRQAEKDRLTAQNDFVCDTKGEEEVRHVMEHLDHQDEIILQILKRIEIQHQEVMLRIGQLDPEMARQLVVDLQQVGEELAEIDGTISGNS